MIIGVDFDNTIVAYDKLFYKIALEKGLIPKDLNRTKNDVRNYLREEDKEDSWTELQGLVYGSRIIEAKPFPGVMDFFKYCIKNGITIYIISHKTKYPVIGGKHDLHDFAQVWLEKQGFYDPKEVGLSRENIFFELTKEEKLDRIVKLKCTHFVDDLPEFLAEKKFPSNVVRILFDPYEKYEGGGSFECVISWNEIMAKIKSLKVESLKGEVGKRIIRTRDYFTSEKFKQDVSNLIKKSEIKGPADFSITPLKGGKNNKIFCVNIKGLGKFLLKAYFQHPNDPRNRLNAEFSFFMFTWENGLRCLPRPYAQDPETQLGLYEFIKGRKIRADEINDYFIKQALDFFIELNKHKDLPKAKDLPAASEACFSIKEHIDCVEERLDRLKNIDDSSKINQKAITFVQNELLSAWNKVVEHAKNFMEKHKIDPTEEVSSDDRCISPSDFGFHNALLDENMKLYFIDFEYAGMDDPIKLICDFFCQPELPVPLDYYNSFAKKVLSITTNPKKHFQRADILLPVYKIKWCCIMLNEFLKDESQRRRFAQENMAQGKIDYEKQKLEQLDKTQRYLESLSLYLKIS